MGLAYALMVELIFDILLNALGRDISGSICSSRPELWPSEVDSSYYPS